MKKIDNRLSNTPYKFYVYYNMSKTLCLFKPEALERDLVSALKQRLTELGFVIEQEKKITPDQATIDAHYHEHLEKDFYSRLQARMVGHPLIALVLSGHGEDTYKVLRDHMGHYLCTTEGSIRKEFGEVIHGSDSLESSEREIKIWFF